MRVNVYCLPSATLCSVDVSADGLSFAQVQRTIVRACLPDSLQPSNTAAAADPTSPTPDDRVGDAVTLILPNGVAFSSGVWTDYVTGLQTASKKLDLPIFAFLNRPDAALLGQTPAVESPFFSVPPYPSSLTDVAQASSGNTPVAPVLTRCRDLCDALRATLSALRTQQKAVDAVQSHVGAMHQQLKSDFTAFATAVTPQLEQYEAVVARYAADCESHSHLVVPDLLLREQTTSRLESGVPLTDFIDEDDTPRRGLTNTVLHRDLENFVTTADHARARLADWDRTLVTVEQDLSAFSALAQAVGEELKNAARQISAGPLYIVEQMQQELESHTASYNDDSNHDQLTDCQRKLTVVLGQLSLSPTSRIPKVGATSLQQFKSLLHHAVTILGAISRTLASISAPTTAPLSLLVPLSVQEHLAHRSLHISRRPAAVCAALFEVARRSEWDRQLAATVGTWAEQTAVAIYNEETRRYAFSQDVECYLPFEVPYLRYAAPRASISASRSGLEEQAAWTAQSAQEYVTRMLSSLSNARLTHAAPHDHTDIDSHRMRESALEAVAARLAATAIQCQHEMQASLGETDRLRKGVPLSILAARGTLPATAATATSILPAAISHSTEEQTGLGISDSSSESSASTTSSGMTTMTAQTSPTSERRLSSDDNSAVVDAATSTSEQVATEPAGDATPRPHHPVSPTMEVPRLPPDDMSKEFDRIAFEYDTLVEMLLTQVQHLRQAKPGSGAAEDQLTEHQRMWSGAADSTRLSNIRPVTGLTSPVPVVPAQVPDTATVADVWRTRLAERFAHAKRIMDLNK
ncbi:hypothetical protein RI367_001010 [Sorochytrium milnesiophthora]